VVSIATTLARVLRRAARGTRTPCASLEGR
jgi:hypothetical protein